MGGEYIGPEVMGKYFGYLLAFCSFVVIVILSVLTLIFNLYPAPYLFFSFKLWLFCLLYFLPSYLLYKKGEKLDISLAMKSFLHWAGLILIFVAFVLVFEPPLRLVLLVIAFYTINHFGGLFARFLTNKTIKRYSNADFLDINSLWVDSFKNFVTIQQMIYYALPVSFFGSLIFGLFFKHTEEQIFMLAVKILLVITLLCQLFILIITFIMLSDKMVEKNPKEKRFDTEALYAKQFGSADANTPEKIKLNVSIALSDVRKLILYNATLNAISFSSMVYVALFVLGKELNLPVTIVIFLTSILLFCDIPFAVGQSKMHEVILDNTEGVTREDLKEKLMKYAGVVPKFPFLLSLTSGFTAGGLLFFVLEKLVKDNLSQLIN